MSNFKYLIWNRRTRSLLIQIFRIFPLKKGRVICVCWGGARYGCNPKAITDVIANTSTSVFQVGYAFINPPKFSNSLPKSFLAIEIGQLFYYYWLSTSQFIISNTRLTGPFFPYKKTNQIYIFSGHGGCGIKKIEFDSAKALTTEYLQNSLIDSTRIDLMISGASFRSKVLRTAYRYCGEILEKGTPRNDEYLLSISKITDLGRDCHYLLYAPTFRNNGRKDVYGFNVDSLVTSLEEQFGGKWYIRVSSHPNMLSYYRQIYDFSHPRLIDVGEEEINSLLLSSDAMITDYSSAAMDFMIKDLNKEHCHWQKSHPVFQLCKDRNDYDRGFYINPEELPFPYAETDEELIANILNFDSEKYLRDLEKFNREVLGLKETGHAAEAVVEWMLAKARRS